jgi:phosphoglycerate dehydrogenase-like enzyme
MTALTANTSEPSGPAEIVIRRVGVVGLGHMGHAFAVNLIEDGHHVSVYDRDPERAAAVTGARAAAQLADLTSCDVLVTSLPDDDALAGLCQVCVLGTRNGCIRYAHLRGFRALIPAWFLAAVV